MREYGYTIAFGYRGRMQDGSWVEYPTEGEYRDAYEEENEEKLETSSV